MYREPLLFFLRTATVPPFCPSKPYFSCHTFAHYSVGRMMSRGSGRNNRGTGRGRKPSPRFNAQYDGVQDSYCGITCNQPDEASIDDHSAVSPERDANSSSKRTRLEISVKSSSYLLVEHILPASDISPNAERTLQDCTSPNRAVGNSSRQPKISLLDSDIDKEWHAHSSNRLRTFQTLKHSQHQSYSPNLANANQRDKLCFSSDIPSPAGKKLHARIYSEKAAVHLRTERPELLPMVIPFDICQSKSGSPFALKPSSLAKNIEQECFKRGEKHILRQGMVLLKNYISHSNQIKIIKMCQELGRGPGGFYQPGYQDGAKLRLQMMCLGKNWDPETRSYGDQRSVDDAYPPSIPDDFKLLVEEAIHDSHVFIEQELKLSNVHEVLPGMSPDTCIVNFYPENGRLGLHKDRDESPESLRSGLPVVSFSIGDSAVFRYGEHRDIKMSNEVVLESGDVLIFGGDSRHLYHGVSYIERKSAPSILVEETNLRPGRLNLTFRKF